MSKEPAKNAAELFRGRYWIRATELNQNDHSWLKDIPAQNLSLTFSTSSNSHLPENFGKAVPSGLLFSGSASTYALGKSPISAPKYEYEVRQVSSDEFVCTLKPKS